MSRDSDLTVVLLYPELLGTYGDRGNASALAQRAQGRGLRVSIVEVALNERAPACGDIYLIGGGEDSSQLLAGRHMRADTNLAKALGDGATCLAVCAGFQLLSRSFVDRGQRSVTGLEVLDVRCGRHSGPRCVGEVVADPVGIPALPRLTGYENHQGDAHLGPLARPLGRLLRGTGNGDGVNEGAIQGNIVATYLHGPVLVRNPALADYLLLQSTGTLAPLHDEDIERLRVERIHEALRHNRRHRSPGRRHRQQTRATVRTFQPERLDVADTPAVGQSS